MNISYARALPSDAGRMRKKKIPSAETSSHPQLDDLAKSISETRSGHVGIGIRRRGARPVWAASEGQWRATKADEDDRNEHGLPEPVSMREIFIQQPRRDPGSA